MGKRLLIHEGQQFNKLTVISELPVIRIPSGQITRIFLCECECGNTTKVRLVHLSRNRIKSCGCLTTKSGKPRHGKHGTPLYNVWRGMKSRIKQYHSEHHLYYDRGITVCAEWENDFEVFESFSIKNGYKEGLQIDRRNNDLGYFPENCRYVTAIVNSNNKRNTIKVIYKGTEYAFMNLIREKGLLGHEDAIKSRMERNYTVERAFDKPIRKGNYKGFVKA